MSSRSAKSSLSAGLAIALLVSVERPAVAQQAAVSVQSNGPQQAAEVPRNGSLQAPPAQQDGGAEQVSPRTRGNGALFRGTDSTSKNRSRALDLSVSVSSAYDDDLSEGYATSLQAPVGGEFSDATATLSFIRKAPKVRVSVTAGSSMRHYPSLGRFVGSSHSASTDLTVDAGRRTTVRTSADGTYVSEFAFDTISRQPGLGHATLVSTGLGVTALDGARLSYGAAAGLTRKVGLRSVLTLNLGARTSERRMINEFADEKMLGGHFARSIGRQTSVGFGYALRSSSQRLGADTRPARGQDLQASIEHTWRHSRERRTVVSVSAGPSLLQLPTPGLEVGSRRIGLVGSAGFSHDMSRSWNLGASVRRGAGSIDGLQSDTAALDLHGLLSRRADLTISGGYSRTDLGLAIGQSRYNTTFASSRLQFALTRAVALYGQYVLYDYDVGSGLALAGPVSFQRQRRGIRGGLTLWMPLHEGR
jgi:hypothetical protein